MDFSFRADRPEFLDQPNITPADIQRNLYELSIINHRLGGHTITLEGFFQLAKNENQIHICEIGCGGGDNLKAIEKRLEGTDSELSFTGIDINADCIHVAEHIKWDNPIRFLLNDYKKVQFEIKPDIIFSSLFCHHFKDAELIHMFQWMRNNAKKG